jgi:hypothetical protein
MRPAQRLVFAIGVITLSVSSFVGCGGEAAVGSDDAAAGTEAAALEDAPTRPRGDATGGLVDADDAGAAVDADGGSDVWSATCPCAAGAICVTPACCPGCLLIDGGIQCDDAGCSMCPLGTYLSNCPVGGMQACLVPCQAPPPYCVPVPQGCTASSPCDCLDASALCGPYGGYCSLGRLDCLGCY